MYGKWGFRDSVNVDTGVVSASYLSLDQGMVMAALGNALGERRAAARVRDPGHRARLRPVIGVEEFNSLAARLHDHGHRRVDDRLRGTSRDDVICGLGGDDRIDGGRRRRRRVRRRRATTASTAATATTPSTATTATTRSSGGFGDDVLSGGPGDDRLAGGSGADFQAGGEGTDQCQASSTDGDADDGCE